MLKFVLGIALLFSTVFATEVERITSKYVSDAKTINCETILKTNDKELIAKSGCCSHHGGVCGCNSGRVVCCDNTYSPTCICKGGEPLEDIKPNI